MATAMDELLPVVQTYDWGDVHAIPELLGVEATGEPQAELWFGTHPRGPARLRRGGAEVPLSEVIAADPEGEVGAPVLERFGAGLPYLVKVLAAARPLSLQLHPSPEQARAGYEAEERQGIPQGESRTFKDRSHKPEVLCALSPFEALCGFRAVDATLRLLDDLAVDRLDPVAAVLRTGRDDATALAVARILHWAGPEARALVDQLGTKAAVLGDRDPVLPWIARLAAWHPDDPGVAVALLLNHLSLEPGEAVHLPAGNLHTYLCGTGVEVMARSDNVVRGGLTSKPVDAERLLELLDPRTIQATPLRPRAVDDVESVYDTPDDEFRVSRLDLPPGHPAERCPGGPEVLLCVEGSAVVDGSTLERGRAAWVPARTPSYRIEAPDDPATVFRVQVGAVAPAGADRGRPLPSGRHDVPS